MTEEAILFSGFQEAVLLKRPFWKWRGYFENIVPPKNVISNIIFNQKKIFKNIFSKEKAIFSKKKALLWHLKKKLAILSKGEKVFFSKGKVFFSKGKGTFF